MGVSRSSCEFLRNRRDAVDRMSLHLAMIMLGAYESLPFTSFCITCALGRCAVIEQNLRTRDIKANPFAVEPRADLGATSSWSLGAGWWDKNHKMVNMEIQSLTKPECHAFVVRTSPVALIEMAKMWRLWTCSKLSSSTQPMGFLMLLCHVWTGSCILRFGITNQASSTKFR